MDVMKISPRRPNQLFRGSLTDHQRFQSGIYMTTRTPHSSKSGRNVRSRVDKTDFPFVGRATWLADRSRNAKFLREGEI